MPSEAQTAPPAPYGLMMRAMHLGLVLFGIAAWLSAELAGEKGSSGYWLHVYLWFIVGFIVLCRFAAGVGGQPPLSFDGWLLFYPSIWRQAVGDVASLLRLRLPERPLHEGLAGLLQAFALVLFAWLVCTGMLMFFLSGEDEAYEMVRNVHEIGELLVPAFLVLHAGAVVLHIAAGHGSWRRMLSLKPGPRPPPRG